jgi:hypothetical protein
MRTGPLIVDYHTAGWWYWLATASLLTAGLAGHSPAFLLAIALTVVQLVHFIVREKSATAFPVQVRFFYLLLLLVALPEPLNVVYWLPAVGTWARVLSGYCTMARCVSLLPWNRSERFSLDLLRRTFLSRPVPGNIMQGLPPLPHA